jgi:ribosomal protein L17
MTSEKKKCYKYLHHHKIDENIQKYKEVRKHAKKVMSKAKSHTYAELYQKLDMKEDKNNVYKMAKF